MRVLLDDLKLDYIVISETKLDGNFPAVQFTEENYEIRARRDRGWHGGGLTELFKTGYNLQKSKAV